VTPILHSVEAPIQGSLDAARPHSPVAQPDPAVASTKSDKLGYAPLPGAMMEEMGKGHLLAIDLGVYGELLSRRYRDRYSCWISNGSIADLLGKCVRTVGYSLKRLEAQGWIKIQHFENGLDPDEPRNHTGRRFFFMRGVDGDTNRSPLQPVATPPCSPLQPPRRHPVATKEDLRKGKLERTFPENVNADFSAPSGRGEAGTEIEAAAPLASPEIQTNPEPQTPPDNDSTSKILEARNVMNHLNSRGHRFDLGPDGVGLVVKKDPHREPLTERQRAVAERAIVDFGPEIRAALGFKAPPDDVGAPIAATPAKRPEAKSVRKLGKQLLHDPNPEISKAWADAFVAMCGDADGDPALTHATVLGIARDAQVGKVGEGQFLQALKWALLPDAKNPGALLIKGFKAWEKLK
jgi:hypothetical protein